MKNTDLEKRALLVSMAGAVVMTVLGVGFAYAADSEAIMLDGVFSMVGFVMASLTLKVASLVNLPDDDLFHFGYAQFVPLLNVFKSLLILILCVVALAFAVEALLTGGRTMVMGNAVIYGVLATSGCVLLALYTRKVRMSTGSALVAVDAENWKIDTLLSGAVLVAFVIGWLVRGTGMDDYLDYLDPLVVAVLCVISLPVPAKILKENARELLQFAPGVSWQKAAEACFLEAMKDIPIDDYRIRLIKMGNSLEILVHVKPGPGFSLEGLAQLDEIRFGFNRALERLEIRTIADVIFVNDMKLAE